VQTPRKTQRQKLKLYPQGTKQRLEADDLFRTC
jgi:hypothetical protein